MAHPETVTNMVADPVRLTMVPSTVVRILMGPIRDTLGVEQGGCASDRIYRLVNNEQLKTAQQSELGVDMGQVVTNTGQIKHNILSGVGQSDDVAHLANSLKSLQALLHLSQLYCDKYQVKLVAAKTKLLIFTNKETEMIAKVDVAVNSIAVDGVEITPSSQATHVGVVRSVVDGNSHHIVARLAAHRGAMYGLQYAGLARGHRGNPYASLRVEAVYGLPVLLSGLASLVLSTKEEQMLDQHYKVYIQRLLRLHQATPAPVVFFLAGCLPLLPLLHLRIFSLFGQLCRLRSGDNIYQVLVLEGERAVWQT